MTKPHEKTYQTHPLDMRVLVEPDPDEGGWLVVADIRVPIDECAQVVALFATAPAMAKALLANGRRNNLLESAWHTHDCWRNNRASCSEACKMTIAALTKAGIPIP